MELSKHNRDLTDEADSDYYSSSSTDAGGFRSPKDILSLEYINKHKYKDNLAKKYGKVGVIITGYREPVSVRPYFLL